MVALRVDFTHFLKVSFDAGRKGFLVVRENREICSRCGVVRLPCEGGDETSFRFAAKFFNANSVFLIDNTENSALLRP